jgi:hypothetical protein
MDRIVRGTLVTLAGMATTLLTAAGLVYLELRHDVAIYSFVYGFVIPIGAFLSGLVAASGYLAGARVLNYRPGRWQMASILLLSGGTFFLIYWLEYWLANVDGKPLRDLVTFGAYLIYMLTHTTLDMSHGTDKPVELGLAGYGFAALLIAGFALGGLCIWAWLRGSAYCEACGLYMKKQGSQTRYLGRREELDACNAAFKQDAGAGQFRKAVDGHGRAGAREPDATTGYSLDVRFMNCAGCGAQWLELISKERTNNRWSRISGVHYSTYCSERIDSIEKLAAR